jgi:hypothetical protein
LAVAVTLILNPAELVRQGRDSTRMSDLATLNNAVSLYLADRHEVEFSETANCTFGTTAPGGVTSSCTENASTTVDGTGWVDINFTKMSTGSPLSRLPIDPVNDDTYYYAFDTVKADSTFEINANMESVRYSKDAGDSAGEDDVESTDGGNNDTWYEVGNSPDLDIL